LGPTATSNYLKRSKYEIEDWSHAGYKKSTSFFNTSISRKIWSLQDFEIGPVMGRGRFATVYLAREKVFGYIVALKVMEKSTLLNHQLEVSLRHEISNQSHLRHDNIVQVYGYFHDANNVYLITENVLYGELFNYVKNVPFGRTNSCIVYSSTSKYFKVYAPKLCNSQRS